MNLIKKINVDIEGNITENFYCDGESILPESYYMLEEELEEDMDMDECDCCEDCYGCEYEEPCECPECTILRYVEKIQEINGDCPCCIEEVLKEFMATIIEHIVVEDVRFQ